MRILDLFCCAGGAGMGYARAGFEVVGVDIVPRPRYPFAFHQGDALAVLATLARGERVRFAHRGGRQVWLGLDDFDAAHASPPCQFATLLKHAPGGKEHVNLIPETRYQLMQTGLPHVIENVEPARPHLRAPQMLCGTMFGLGTEGHVLQRHRLFETNWLMTSPGPCNHGSAPVVGVYGGHARRRSAKHGGRGTRDVWANGHRAAMSEAMGGMDWATCNEISEAIPPAYTEHIGRQLMAVLDRRAAA